MGIIDINNIDLTIGKTNILKNITVSFDEGKIHGLIGRNGSGKTMLMKLSLIHISEPTRPY